MMTADEYVAATGYEPEDDDLERVNCPKAGKAGHLQCGWCITHNKPKFICNCWAK